MNKYTIYFTDGLVKEINADLMTDYNVYHFMNHEPVATRPGTQGFLPPFIIMPKLHVKFMEIEYGK